MIAGALAVELMVSVIQHPLGLNAPAPGLSNEDTVRDEDSCLGIVPHQIRGFLSRFQDVLPSTSAFTLCTGCSPKVVNKYLDEGIEFLLKAFNDPTYLEELTGLDELHKETNLADVWALSDDEQCESECSFT